MKMLKTLLFVVIAGIALMTFYAPSLKSMEISETIKAEMPDNAAVATLAGGCFWCIESEFRSLKGVLYTRVGYEGGALDDPTYRDITTGKTGHAEAIEVYFDPALITYAELVEYFLTKAHDPTQKDRQGVDVGTQYRSAIFYHDDTQKEIAVKAIKAATEAKVWKNPIVTEISPKSKFWLGEDYHQQYYEKYKEETGRDHIRVLLKKTK